MPRGLAMEGRNAHRVTGLGGFAADGGRQLLPIGANLAGTLDCFKCITVGARPTEAGPDARHVEIVDRLTLARPGDAFVKESRRRVIG